MTATETLLDSAKILLRIRCGRKQIQIRTNALQVGVWETLRERESSGKAFRT
jgi:hypothetical protein